MILEPERVTLIGQGKITRLIVPVAEGRRYRVGDSYPVQWWRPREGGGAPVVSEEKLRVRVTDRETLRLADLSAEFVELAGFESLGAFYGFWKDTHGQVPRVGDVVLDHEVAAVGFELDRLARERYLLPKGGYTFSSRRAMRTPAGGEPVAPDLEVERAVPTEWERRNSIEAKQRFSKSKAKDEARLEAKSRAARLKEAERRAENKGADISDLTEKVDAAIEEMRQRESNGDEEAA